MKQIMPVFCLILFSAFLACEPPLIIQSKWTDAEVAFRGDTGAWKTMVQYPEDPQFGIGARNNGKYLYLCMASWKREANGKIIRYGFTTWFTSKSRKGKRFGLHFPMGLPGNGVAGGRHHHRGAEPPADRDQLEESFQKMELLGPGKNDSIPVKTAIAETFGISTRIFPTEENLVYFIKIPLNSDSANPYAINAGTDSLVSVSFASDVPDLPSAQSGESESSSPPMGVGGGGGGRQGGGMHSGGGGHEGSAQEDIVEPFAAGFTIGLAKKP